MKRGMAVVAVLLVVVLALAALVACRTTGGQDCDAAGPTAVQVMAKPGPGGGGGGRGGTRGGVKGGGGAKPKPVKQPKPVIVPPLHRDHDDDCDDD